MFLTGFHWFSYSYPITLFQWFFFHESHFHWLYSISLRHAFSSHTAGLLCSLVFMSMHFLPSFHLPCISCFFMNFPVILILLYYFFPYFLGFWFFICISFMLACLFAFPFLAHISIFSIFYPCPICYFIHSNKLIAVPLEEKIPTLP